MEAGTTEPRTERLLRPQAGRSRQPVQHGASIPFSRFGSAAQTISYFFHVVIDSISISLAFRILLPLSRATPVDRVIIAHHQRRAREEPGDVDPRPETGRK